MSDKEATLEVAAVAAYLGPAVSALAFVTIAFASVGLEDAPRLLVWLGAQVALALRVATSRGRGEASARAFVGQIATTTLTIFVVFRQQLEPTAQNDLATLVFLLVLAAPSGAVAGAMLATWQHLLVRVVEDVRAAPSHEALDRVMQGAFGRVSAVNLALAGLVALGEPGAIDVVGAAFVVPGSIALAFAMRRALRRRWLTRVESGLVDGWRIVEDRAAWSKLALLPVHVPRRTEGGARVGRRVLVRVAKARHPFRDAEAMTPFAVVL
jgi:hypothetical protein